MASFEHYRNLRDIKDNPMHRHKKERNINDMCCKYVVKCSTDFSFKYLNSKRKFPSEYRSKIIFCLEFDINLGI